MRIIHTRKRIFQKDSGLSNKFNLLVWILSVLNWKYYGNEVILYCDNKTLTDIKKIGFDYLYDEINTTLLEDKKLSEGIDFLMYWAMPKLLALRYEVVDLGNDCVISDQDVVPMSDVSRLWTNSDIAVWSNKEFVNVRTVYPKLKDLSLPKNYLLPRWFTGIAKPLNTGIIHIKDKEIVDLYTSEALKMARYNTNNNENSVCQTMCNAEQRMLGEIVKYKKLSYSVMQPINQGLFNKNGFHTHGYKVSIRNTSSVGLWNLNLLLMIKEKDNKMFNTLINKPYFKIEKEYFEKNGYKCDKIKELTIYY